VHRQYKAKSWRPAVQCVDEYTVIPEGVGGATEKDVLEDPASGIRYIAKLGGRNSDLEVITEYAIFLIARTIGMRVAEGRIATYHGQLRFLSRYFLRRDVPEELVHGMQLFNELYDENTVQDALRDELSEQAMFSVQRVKSAFGAHYIQYGADIEEELFDDFVAMLAHDALIGVQDRHHENWGIVVQRDVVGPRPRFAPLYDSARGLFCNETDAGLSKFLGREGSQRLDGYVSRARPLVGFDGLHPQRGRKYVTHDQLLAAVYRAYPAQRRRIESVLDAYDWQLVRDTLRAELGGLWSKRRITLILTCLRRRLKAIRRAIHGT
jgi:HipA-like protein